MQLRQVLNTRPIVIISTRLPPQVCGIGTYSWLLHRNWPADGSQQRFVVIDGASESVNNLGYREISEFGGEAAKLFDILDRAGPVDVFLHYAGRAYHRYGCPGWLPTVLAKWKQKFPGGRLIILFHEVPGQLPIFSRHYWLNWGNERVIQKLARMADVIVTNTSQHAAKIRKLAARNDIHLIPVGANIEVAPDFSGKRIRSEFVIFGLPFGRWQTMGMFDQEIRSWQQSGCLTKLHLIGPRDTKFDSRAESLMKAYSNVVIRHGQLSSAEISRLLATAQFALTNATPETWSKSGGFMAYAAHGCAIVAKSRSGPEPFSLTILPEEVATISDVDLRKKTRSLQEWYARNASWNNIAQRIHDLVATGRQPKN